jgi:AcrR family transcriptional regulator
MAYRETERTKQRKDEQRQAILNAARRLVSRGGFRAAQVSAVAEGAGIATGTIYRYFPTQSDLFAELFRINTEREVEAMDAALHEGDSATARLRNALYVFTERALRNRKLAYALIAEPVDPQVEAERLKYRRAYAQLIENILGEGLARKEFAPQDPHVSAAALVGALAESLLGPLVRSAPSVRKSASDSIVEFCMRAAGAQE